MAEATFVRSTGPCAVVRTNLAVAGVALAAAFALLPGAAARAAELPPPSRPPAEVREAVREVLDRREFRQPRPSLLARARAWLLAQLGRVIAALLQGGGASAVGWAVVAVLTGLVGFFGWRFVRGLSRDPEAVAATPTTPRRSPREWAAEAEAHERRGEWRQALRCRYRALVAELAARGLVDEVPGRTTGEYRAEVASSAPGVAADFSGATELFERAWYGNRPTGRDEVGRFRSLAERVTATVAA